MKKKMFWVLLSLLMSTLTTVSCQIGQTEEMSPLDTQLTHYALKTEDLPTGWKFSDKSFGVEFGGSAYTAVYELEVDTSMFLSNTVAIYVNDNKAKLAYQQWEDLWFKSTQPWPEATYSPQDQKDDYRFECLNALPGSSVLSCVYLQRHKNIIGFVHVRFDNKDLTFTQLNNILGILDKKLSEDTVNLTPTP